MNRTLRSSINVLRTLTTAVKQAQPCHHGTSLNTCHLPSVMWITQRGMAGHSKWQNIRHTKGAKDAQKSRTSIVINRKIKVAIREGGGTDPKNNHLLSRIIEEAGRLDVPKVTIQNAIKQSEKQQKDGKPVMLECRGPGNCMLIVECYTPSAKTARQNLTYVLKKVGGSVLDKGMAVHYFEQKGVVNVELPSDSTVNQDEAEEIAIDVEAEDVSISSNENEYRSLQFICDVQDMKAVRENLSKKDYNPTSSLEYIPTIFATLNEQDQKLAEFMFDKFDALDEIIKIHDNIEIAS